MAVYIKVQKMWQKNGKKWANQMYIIGLLIFNGTQTRAGLLQETAKKVHDQLLVWGIGDI